MGWIARVFAPWFACGFVLGVSFWCAVYVNAWLILPGVVAAAFVACALFPPERVRS